MADALYGELRRLYAGGGELQGEGIPALAADGSLHALLIRFLRPTDWPHVAALLEQLASVPTLPVPAVSVAAQGGYGVWLAFAEAQPADRVRRLTDALRRTCLADLPPAALDFLPATGVAHLPLVPAFDPVAERWSAFIDPGMGSMFVADPGLEMPPAPGRQAEMLAALAAIPTRVFGELLAHCEAASGVSAQPGDPSAGRVEARMDTQHADPVSFLLAAMNDTSLPVGERIRAAAALLSAGWPR